MNPIEQLPRVIEYKGQIYSIRLHTNFKNDLVIQYNGIDNRGYILSYVVQPDHQPYHPECIESSNGRFNENIGNDKSLNKCINEIKRKIKELNIKEI